MDWIRRMMGFPDRRPDADGNPFRNPSFEEIMGNNNRMNSPYFHHPGNFQDDDSFMSVFSQMDSMFQQLDSMMQGLHQHPGQIIITEIPGTDFLQDSETPLPRQSPRDFMLKAPDSKLPGFPQDRNIEGNVEEEHESWGPHGFGGGFGAFGGIHGGIHGGQNPFHMMEEFFHNFGRHFGGSPFDESPFHGPQGPPMLPGPDTDNSNNRDSLLREDKDLDDRVSGGISQLLKEGPQYDSPSRGRPLGPPDGGLVQPSVTHRYQSSVITRIRKPDGSIEETRKYRDSSGREEEVVTHIQPENSSSPGSLLKPEGEGRIDQPPGVPSIFSWIFTR